MGGGGHSGDGDGDNSGGGGDARGGIAGAGRCNDGVCGDEARARAVDDVGTGATAGPLRGSLAFGRHCGRNRGGERASLGSLESLDDEEVGGVWPAVANAPVSLTFPVLLSQFMDAGTDTTHARGVGPPGIGTNERGEHRWP